MSITNRNWTKRADHLANEYNNSRSDIERGRIKVEWYVECGKIAAHIETHRSISEKKVERCMKLKKAPSKPSK